MLLCDFGNEPQVDYNRVGPDGVLIPRLSGPVAFSGNETVTWVRIDDHFDEHPKLAEAGVVCWGVWLAGIAYCNRNLTDGFIPWGVARTIGSWEVLDVEAEEGKRRVWDIARACGMSGEDMDTPWIVSRLVAIGLWEQVDGGYRIHDYSDYQPTKADVLDQREKTKGRVSDWRKRKGNAVTNDVSNAGGNGVGTPSPVPGPVPVPNPSPSPARDGETSLKDAADAYYSITGRFPTDTVLDWLNRLGRVYGEELTSSKISEQYLADSNRRTLLSRTEEALKAATHTRKPSTSHDGQHPGCMVCAPLRPAQA